LLCLGGGAALVQQATAQQKQWAAGHAHLSLSHLLDFLVSHDGLDFHSDETDVEDEVVPVGAAGPCIWPAGGAGEPEMQLAAEALAREPRTPYKAVRRMALAHSFRSQLAADMLHELDSGVPRAHSSRDRVGAALSVRMAHALLKRPDLTSLVDQDQVEAVAASKKRKGPAGLAEGEDAYDSVLPISEGTPRHVRKSTAPTTHTRSRDQQARGQA
jgi:hypothetical protein